MLEIRGRYIVIDSPGIRRGFIKMDDIIACDAHTYENLSIERCGYVNIYTKSHMINFLVDKPKEVVDKILNELIALPE